jgi:Asp-tRNA(Asn)/Glu-tRNA(Gln) amidotransferase A subunit family amidase
VSSESLARSVELTPVCPAGDIGGSLRIPAHYSGCYGLKPCAGRFPATGAANPNPGFEAINTSFGPMGRSVADLELVTRVVTDASIALSRTEALVPLAYRDVALPNKLRFGYYLTGEFAPANCLWRLR